MCEEEIIKCAEFLGNRKDETTVKIDNDFYDERDIWKGLLDLFNKEKEKNYNLTHVLFTGESDYISKDKINNLLKKYENEHFIAKVDLKSILEDNV